MSITDTSKTFSYITRCADLEEQIVFQRPAVRHIILQSIVISILNRKYSVVIFCDSIINYGLIRFAYSGMIQPVGHECRTEFIIIVGISCVPTLPQQVGIGSKSHYTLQWWRI